MASQQLRPPYPAQPLSVEQQRSPCPLSGPIRKVGYLLACEICRKRKKKCDRTRPACLRCTQRNLRCEYSDDPQSATSTAQLDRLAQLSREPSALKDTLTALPYFEALELFNLLREVLPQHASVKTSIETSPSSPSSSTSPSLFSAMSTFSSVLSPSPLSQYDLVGSVPIPAFSPLEQELMVWHPVAYPVLPPIAASSVALEELLAAPRPDVFHTGLLPDAASPASASPDRVTNLDNEPVKSDFFKKLSHMSPLHLGFLDQVDISSWTSLPIPNQTAVRVIALYLNNDYQVLPLFNVDLFLRDLAQSQSYFCSSLLVSALLGWACQAYTRILPKAASWSSLFFLDAQSQWGRLGHDESVTLSSLSALQLLSMTAVTHGQDELALMYIRRALELGKTMGLINVMPGAQSAAGWLDGYPDWQRAASYTAWGIFNWASVFSLHYHKAEIIAPPRIMMPGDIEVALAAQEGKSVRLPTNVQVFRANCKLWTIFAPVATAYYGRANNAPPAQNHTVEFAEDVYRQLLTWAEILPPDLLRQPGSSHSVLMMHVYYHAIITDLFRPFLYLSDPLSTTLRTFNVDGGTPEMVYFASIRQMKRLLLSYHHEFGIEALSVLWQTCIIYVANATIRTGNDKNNETRFFLHLCLVGLEELCLSYRVFGSITKGILGMAVRQGVVEQDQVRRIRSRLKKIEQRFMLDISSDEIMARWMIDLDLAVTEPVLAQGGKLAEEFDRMTHSPHETGEQ